MLVHLLSCSCFIGDTAVFFGAFLGPILAVILFNCVAFVLVVGALINHQTRKSKRTTERKGLYGDIIRLLIIISGLVALFGLTWLFAALTVTDSSVVFEVLFALCNTTQGFFVFLLFCVFNTDSRAQWKEAFNKILGRKMPGGEASSSKPNRLQLRLSQRRANPLSDRRTASTLEVTTGPVPTDESTSSWPPAKLPDYSETQVEDGPTSLDNQGHIERQLTPNGQNEIQAGLLEMNQD